MAWGFEGSQLQHELNYFTNIIIKSNNKYELKYFNNKNVYPNDLDTLWRKNQKKW